MILNVVFYRKCILDGVVFVNVFIFILILYINIIIDGYKMYFFKINIIGIYLDLECFVG